MNLERVPHPPGAHNFQAIEVIAAGEIDEILYDVVVSHGAIALDPTEFHAIAYSAEITVDCLEAMAQSSPVAAARRGPLPRETLAKLVNSYRITLLLESTSCGNRPVRRANLFNELPLLTQIGILHNSCVSARFARDLQPGELQKTLGI
jgi:hypothetical protein